MREDVKVAIALVVLVVSAALMYFCYTGPAPAIRVARLTPYFGPDCLSGPRPMAPLAAVTQPSPATEADSTPQPQRPSGQPAPAWRTHVVQKGDTLAEIADRYLGSEKYAEDLQKLNPEVEPRRLHVGQQIRVPILAAKPDELPKPVLPKPGRPKTPREYRVKPGESFSTIARKVYGDATLWQQLFELNREAVNGDPRRLQAGQVIRLLDEPSGSP
jgi:nucleoid-associated protein YgaU